MHTVLALREGQVTDIAGHVPHLEEAVALVVPGPAALGQRGVRVGVAALVRALGKQDRVAGVLGGLVEHADQVG